MGDVLHSLLPAWYATSRARQQCALLVVARVGTMLSRTALADVSAGRPPSFPADDPAFKHEMLRAATGLAAAAEELVQAPLRPLLEAAAPALVPAAEEVRRQVRAAGGRLGWDDVVVAIDIMQFADDLADQLDPLALGLRLPGCYNPWCRSLAGASEADAPLKRCAGCKVARWVGWPAGNRGCTKGQRAAGWVCNPQLLVRLRWRR
jgi:hypothetical protein